MSYSEVITECADFDAPAPVVWNLLLDWGAIIDWMPDGYIQNLRLEGSGPGAVRHLVTGKGIHLSERLDIADEPRGELELSMVGPLPWSLLSYRATGKIDRISDQRSRLTWQGTLTLPDRGTESDQVVKLLRKSYRKMFLGIQRKVEA